MKELASLKKRLKTCSVKERKKLTKSLAKKHVSFFSSFYIANNTDKEFLTIPDFHKEIYELLTETDKLAIAAPRGFAKSSIVSLFYPLWAALFEERKDILLVSGTGTLAEDWLAKIKNHLENNQLILADFGYQKSSKWTQSHIRLRNGTEIRAKGRGYQIRGFRPDLVICDDLEDDELVRSKRQRDKLDNWFWKAVINTLSKKGQIVVIGTILHPMSFLSKLLERKDWVTRKYTAFNDDGHSIWPEMYSDKDLNKKRKANPDAFMSEYMNAPKLENQQIVKRKKIQNIEEGDMPKFNEMTVYTAVDPASSKRETADYTAIVTLGVSQRKEDKGEIYVIDSDRGRWTPYETSEKLLEKYGKYRMDRIAIEDVAYQRALADILREEWRKEHGKYPNVLQIDADHDKVRRAQKVLHIVEQELVHMDKFESDADLYEELSLFPQGDYDDLADAFFHGLNVVANYSVQPGIGKKSEGTNKSNEGGIYHDVNLQNILKQNKKSNWYSY